MFGTQQYLLWLTMLMMILVLVRLVTLLDVRRRVVISTPDLRFHRGEYEHTRMPWSFQRKGELLSSWNGCCCCLHVSSVRVPVIVIESFATAVVDYPQRPCRISSPSLNPPKNMVAQTDIPTLTVKIDAFCPSTLTRAFKLELLLGCGWERVVRKNSTKMRKYSSSG